MTESNSDRLLDDRTLYPEEAVGRARLLYARWLSRCSGVVGLVAAFAGLFFFYLSVNYLESLRWRSFEFLVAFFLFGSTLTCGVLLWGCWRAMEYARALRSASLAGATEVEHWAHASERGGALWRVAALALLLLVGSWGPILTYEGGRDLWWRYQYQTGTEWYEDEAVEVVEEAIPQDPPEEIIGDGKGDASEPE